MRARVTACALLFSMTIIADAQAQVYLGSTDSPQRGSFEVSGGVVYAGGFSLGDLAAELTNNDGNNAPGFTLFTTDTRVKPAIGVQGRAGFYLSKSISFEAGVQYSRPVVATELSGDAEEADEITAEETMNRYIVDGSLLFYLQPLAFGSGRGMPFIAVGAGYLRELHEGNELVETGTEYHAGVGIKFWLTQGSSRIGIRGDVGVSVRDGGFDFEDKRRMLPTAGASLVYLF